MLSWSGLWQNDPFILELCWSQLDGAGRIDWQHWSKVLVLLEKKSIKQASYCTTSAEPLSADGDSDLVSWKLGMPEWVGVCVSARSVCPQKRACFHLQVNINNTFCHQGMFVKAKGHHSTGRGRRATFHNLPLLAPKTPPYYQPLNLHLPFWMGVLACSSTGLEYHRVNKFTHFGRLWYLS